MGKIKYFLLVETMIFDKVGRVSLINIFNRVLSPTDKAIPARFAFALALSPEKSDVKAGKMKLLVTVSSPSGLEVVKANGEAVITPEQINRAALVTSFDLSNQVEFTEAGYYQAKLFIGDKQVAELEFEVVLNATSTEEAA